MYIASIEIAISNQSMTKSFITPQERAAIGKAAKNDKVAMSYGDRLLALQLVGLLEEYWVQ